MTTRIEVSKAHKEAQKSFEVSVTMLLTFSSICSTTRDYLKERGITKEYLTKKTQSKTLVCKAELMKYCKLHEFTAKDGSTYKAIYRKDKDGNIVEAKWSVWAVMCAIDNMVKAKAEAKTIKEAIEGKKAVAKAEAKAEQEETIREEVRAEGKAKRTTAASIKAASKKTNKKAA